ESFSAGRSFFEFLQRQRAKFIDKNLSVERAFREKIERFVAGEQKKTVGAFEESVVILPAQIRFDIPHLKKNPFFAEAERLFRLIKRLALPFAFQRMAADDGNSEADDQTERQGAQSHEVRIAEEIEQRARHHQQDAADFLLSEGVAAGAQEFTRGEVLFPIQEEADLIAH